MELICFRNQGMEMVRRKKLADPHGAPQPRGTQKGNSREQNWEGSRRHHGNLRVVHVHHSEITSKVMMSEVQTSSGETTPKKQQASEMVAQTLVRPTLPPLPPPCPASINPASSPYQSALAHDISAQVS